MTLTPEPDRTDEISESFELLSDPLRRRILVQLHGYDPQAECQPDELAGGRDRSEVEIHHRHLPKLADAGVIDWDRDANVVRRGRRFDEIAPLLELIDNHRDELPTEWP